MPYDRRAQALSIVIWIAALGVAAQRASDSWKRWSLAAPVNGLATGARNRSPASWVVLAAFKLLAMLKPRILLISV